VDIIIIIIDNRWIQITPFNNLSELYNQRYCTTILLLECHLLIIFLIFSMGIIILSRAMFSISRNLCYKNIQQTTATYFVVHSIRHHHHSWKNDKFFIQDKIDFRKLQFLKLYKYDFHTTQSLHIPPLVAILMRPVLTIGSFLIGRRLKRWWRRKSEKEKEEYKQWFKERINVFLGKSCRILNNCY